MQLSMYHASIPLLIRGLSQLNHILAFAARHADDNKIDPNVLLQARLFPNMFPLVRQVQIATDIAKGCGSRLAGSTPPSFEDSESSFEELQARVAKTLALLESCRQEDIDDSEKRTIELKLGGNHTRLDGYTYLTGFVLPNFYFHLTTTYNILRHNGVALGKADYMGQLPTL